MKLKKPFNQIKGTLQRAAGVSGYRFLSLLITVLLFFSPNSQVMAASMPIGANYASTSAPITARDQLNAASFFKQGDSSTNASDSQQWTTLGKIEAVISGIATLAAVSYGGARAYRSYYRAEEGVPLTEENLRVASGRIMDDVSHGDGRSLGQQSNGLFVSVSAGYERAKQQALSWAERITALTPLWTDRISALKSQGWNLVTLKACWPATIELSAASSEEALPDVTSQNAEKVAAVKEVLQAAQQRRQEQAEAATKNNRTWAQWCGLSQQDQRKDHRTKWQQAVAAMKTLEAKGVDQLSQAERLEYDEHQDKKIRREEAIQTLRPTDDIETMLKVLDREILEPTKNLAQPYAQKVAQQTIEKTEQTREEIEKKFVYFMAKNQDELELHPGNLEALSNAFDQDQSEDSFNKLRDAVDTLWENGSKTPSPLTTPTHKVKSESNSTEQPTRTI